MDMILRLEEGFVERYEERLAEIAETLQAYFGDVEIETLDWQEESGELEVYLGTLAGSERGGILVIAGNLFDLHRVDEALKRLKAFYPILEIHFQDLSADRFDVLESDRVWSVRVSGTESAPGRTPNPLEALMTAELRPVMNAALTDLDLSPLGIKWPRFSDPSSRDALDDFPDNGQFLLESGIVTKRAGRPFPTVAGIIALGQRTHRFLDGLQADISLFGRQLCWDGSLLTLDNFMNSVFTPAKVQSELASLIRHVLVNAILHRDWRPGCDYVPISMRVEPGRLEVRHPGLLHPTWRIGQSTPLNPKLHALACRLRLATGRGAGMAAIASATRKLRGQTFSLKSVGGVVHLVVEWPNNRGQSEQQKVSNNTQPPIPEAPVNPTQKPVPVHPSHVASTVVPLDSAPRQTQTVAAARPEMPRVEVSRADVPQAPTEPTHPPLEKRERTLLQALRPGIPTTTRDLMRQLGWTRWATRTALDRLIAAGMVRTSAPSPTSPLQMYRVV